MKGAGILVVSLRGVIFRYLVTLRVFQQKVCKVSFRVAWPHASLGVTRIMI